MSKVSLERVNSSFGFQAAYNRCLEQIEKEFSEKVLYRDNPPSEANSMSNDLDMAGNDLLNVRLISADIFRVGGSDISVSFSEAEAALATVMGSVAEVETYRDQAEMSASSAEDSMVAAAASETDADIYKIAAAISAGTASSSANTASSARDTAVLKANEAAASAAVAGAAVNAAAWSAATNYVVGNVIYTTSGKTYRCVRNNINDNPDTDDGADWFLMTLAIGETSLTAYRGDRGKIGYDHSQVAHAPSNAQKNSDIIKAEIEAKLTGTITTHGHASVGVENEAPNTVVQRDALSDVYCRTIRSSIYLDSTISGAMAFRINDSSNNYLRFCNNPAAIREWLGTSSDLVLTTGSLVYACSMLEIAKAGLTANAYGAGLAARSNGSAIAEWLSAHQGNAKAIRMDHAGQVTVSFATKNSASTSYCRIVLNSTLVQEWAVSTTYTTRTATVSVAKGDIIQIQVRDDDNIIGYVKDFQILVATLP